MRHNWYFREKLQFVDEVLQAIKEEVVATAIECYCDIKISYCINGNFLSLSLSLTVLRNPQAYS